jgi:hypothetical protein
MWGHADSGDHDLDARVGKDGVELGRELSSRSLTMKPAWQ